MPRVINKHKEKNPDGVYIGRPSKWGNPFVVNRDGTREEVIALYEAMLMASDLKNDLHELEGKNLICWCHPLPCHGDVLLRLANVST